MSEFEVKYWHIITATFVNCSSADKEDVVKVIQEGGEGLTEDKLKSTFEKLRPEIRYK